MDAWSTAEAIASGRLSATAAVTEALAAIRSRDGPVNAFTIVRDDAALAAAAAVDHGDRTGPLAGVPISVKDHVWLAGWPSTNGSRALAGFVPDQDCECVARLVAAGAVVVGKTNNPEFCYRGTTFNEVYGVTRNPRDTSRTTGGSSGGAAASVAAGMVPLAVGTDGGGSIRIPSAWCGVYGYKQSWGRVPGIFRPNAFAGTDPFLFEGVITRTVADAALGMTVLAGHDPRDPFSARDEVDFLGALDRGVAGMRIAYSPDLDVFPVDRRVAAAVAEAVRAFEEAGAHVEEVRLGITRDQRELSDLWCRLIMLTNVETIEGLRAAGHDVRADLPPEYLRWLDIGYGLTARDVARDQRMRTEVYDAVQGVFAGHDLLINPTVACLPVPNADDGNTVGPSEVECVAVDPLIGWCLTYIANLTGHPAASIPAGMVDGLPVGMQIMGRSGADDDVIAASAAFERLRPWSYDGRTSTAAG